MSQSTCLKNSERMNFPLEVASNVQSTSLDSRQILCHLYYYCHFTCIENWLKIVLYLTHTYTTNKWQSQNWNSEWQDFKSHPLALPRPLLSSHTGASWDMKAMIRASLLCNRYASKYFIYYILIHLALYALGIITIIITITLVIFAFEETEPKKS